MTPVWWMIGASVAGWFAVASVSRDVIVDVGFGMLGPLASAVGTWLLIDRTARRDLSRLTAAMLQAFLVKVLFFGVYVVVMLRVLSLRPMPFVLSFTCAFLALHVYEAVLLHRLTVRGTRAAS